MCQFSSGAARRKWLERCLCRSHTPWAPTYRVSEGLRRAKRAS